MNRLTVALRTTELGVPCARRDEPGLMNMTTLYVQCSLRPQG